MTTTTKAKRSSAYWQRFEMFAVQSTFFTEATVHYDEDGHEFFARSLPSEGAACQCCGTLRLKHRFPVLLDGDKALIRWIGHDCLENLHKAGKLRSQFPSPVIDLIAKAR